MDTDEHMHTQLHTRNSRRTFKWTRTGDMEGKLGRGCLDESLRDAPRAWGLRMGCGRGDTESETERPRGQHLT